MKKTTQSNTNPFKYSDTNKRYYTYDYYLKQMFGAKVAKIPLDAGFSCPNIDGTRGFGGCIYCSERGSGDFAQSPALKISEQYKKARNQINQKWQTNLTIPYFQAHTNTYSNINTLRKLYSEALSFEGAVGLNIATRPDCLPNEVIELLCEIADKTVLTIELGLQSVHDSTAKLINRSHSYSEFLDGYKKLRGASDKINICVHLIEGLPLETHEMMLDSARELAKLKPNQVKIHCLNILKNTALEKMYLEGKYTPIDMQNYIEIVCDSLEVLPPDTVIGRLTGDADRNKLTSPLWTLNKTDVLNSIDKEMYKRNSFQGKLYSQDSTV